MCRPFKLKNIISVSIAIIIRRLVTNNRPIPA